MWGWESWSSSLLRNPREMTQPDGPANLSSQKGLKHSIFSCSLGTMGWGAALSEPSRGAEIASPRSLQVISHYCPLSLVRVREHLDARRQPWLELLSAN